MMLEGAGGNHSLLYYHASHVARTIAYYQQVWKHAFEVCLTQEELPPSGKNICDTYLVKAIIVLRWLAGANAMA